MEATSSPRRPSSHPASSGRGVSPTSSLFGACEAAAGTSTGLWEVSPVLSHQPWSTTAPPGQTVGLGEKPRATPFLTFHFQSSQWLLGGISDLGYLVSYLCKWWISAVQLPPAVLKCLTNPQPTRGCLCACLALSATPHFFTSFYREEHQSSSEILNPCFEVNLFLC